ncbi:50S ribosome-binding GTPase [Ceratobasidium sp. AG-Ba]|nr:50S ribosome-binding GTPase [Ceratobasidium sp. AG-Ba]
MTVDNALIAYVFVISTSAVPKSNQVFECSSVFGATGTGKTTFVNDASGASFVIGHKSQSCTQDVSQSPVFQVNGRNIVLFDTPGFDDTELSDTEILRRIATFLTDSYKNGSKLTGILYFHRITDIRVGGISRRTFSVFRNLCGNDSLSNVLIVTNMWSDPPTQAQIDRETELREHKDFFKPALEKGARMVRRSHKTKESAHEILKMLIEQEAIAMKIQRELVDEQKKLAETRAAQEIERELRIAAEKHQAELAKAKADMEAAQREREEQARRQREEQQARARAEEEKRAREREEMRRRIQEEQEQRRREAEAARAAQEAMERARREMEEAARRQREEAEAHARHLAERAAQLQREIDNRQDCVLF